ncbi:MAG: TRAM domain-containing protein, partial [Synergistaceae bacterium]|nr:TRAM domain-containing protein [Synergistaceae bacterium]
MKEKEILTVEIDGISSEGEGIARYGAEHGAAERKFVVFVEGALPGERVKCRVSKVGHSYARAELT